jgi:hypothetical protein
LRQLLVAPWLRSQPAAPLARPRRFGCCGPCFPVWSVLTSFGTWPQSRPACHRRAKRLPVNPSLCVAEKEFLPEKPPPSPPFCMPLRCRKLSIPDQRQHPAHLLHVMQQRRNQPDGQRPQPSHLSICRSHVPHNMTGAPPGSTCGNTDFSTPLYYGR